MSKLRIVLCALALLVGAVPALARSQLPSTDAEKLAALSRLRQCFAANIELYDDGISDAATIGRGAAQMCRATIIEIANVYSQGGDHDLMQGMQQKFIADAPDNALVSVLQVRAAKRKTKTHF
jgi:hypothetical protein